MANGIFFKNWQLWQQMTFVLAMCIISVFCLGLGKLWYNNRLMRKQEILDEEKRARFTEMRKAGVPVSSKRGAEIPFGVRAIQGGVEVDGIWISRPATPNVETKTRLQSTTTLIGTDADPNKKGKQVDDSRSTTEQRGSQSDASIFQRLTDAESLASNGSGTPRKSQFASRPKHPRVVSALNEDTLRRLDRYSPTRTTYDTYIPARNPRRPSQRSSASSSGESTDSQPRSGVSARSGSGRSYASSHSSRMYTSRARLDSRPSYTSVPRGSPEKERRDPYESSGTRTPISPLTYGGNYSPPLSGQELPAPEPTFGPGDLHANKPSRKANPDFEVLPAGTSGTLHGFRANGDNVDADGFEPQNLAPRPARATRQMSYTQTLQQQNASRNF
ncbi:hypothetical protein CONLIGDRAFT_61490 [Coniochaeta ligniaria NRRL 30616]|uniref:Uncharacterized protein n=1 Tax=Coniochaeta ligniaria NRRL 30616 TaxID=1408157 RepID=A0A1J7J831_9PEZI|nr:hypothetical protein CONLIGDRAFT_61490 [Coniochaeta ligniaria NRRL 30616]